MKEYSQEYIAIVICNNTGAGLDRGKLVPQEMRVKTVITWTSNPSESMKAPYRELGYEHFTTQRGADNYIRTHLLKS